ncbi:uncharacterized protein B0T15DRAFT_572141 [Chaetomium strumarium]|uniref:Uncharacterized protein n=1 Tax=Chaetomium strumarium TaxID=1170767 RepID=A0AAJ0GXU5_9PEZI|nr:hypothetical protein B0T15DRAFT_572141 [Chaetomium strumarium]
MCILRIPRHSWCFCPDPSAVDSDGSLLCPHHISLHPETTPSTLPPTVQFYLYSCLTSIPRPGPDWEHCATYQAAHKSGYILDPGYELSCPETIIAAAAAASPGRRKREAERMIALHLTPLRERFEIDSALFDGGGRRVRYHWYHHDVPCGLTTLDDDQPLDELVEKRILSRPGAADDWGVYVDVVEGVVVVVDVVDDDDDDGGETETGTGRRRRCCCCWGVDVDASAVFLLPGMGYDAETVARKMERVMGEENKKEKKKMMGEGWLSVDGVMKAMGKFL